MHPIERIPLSTCTFFKRSIRIQYVNPPSLEQSQNTVSRESRQFLPYTPAEKGLFFLPTHKVFASLTPREQGIKGIAPGRFSPHRSSRRYCALGIRAHPLGVDVLVSGLSETCFLVRERSFRPLTEFFTFRGRSKEEMRACAVHARLWIFFIRYDGYGGVTVVERN